MTPESEATFRPFDPEGEFHFYVRNLPHWRQPGATYFATFRLDDSIPAKVLAQWLDERQRWYRGNGLDPALRQSAPNDFARAYLRISKEKRRAFERQQARQLHEELDQCHGSCVLRRAAPRTEVVSSLKFFDAQRLWLGDWVVMPNHVHAIVTPFEGWELEDLLGSIKKWTSRAIRQRLQTQPAASRPTGPPHNKRRLWQYESFDRIIRDPEELGRVRRYIASNPEKARLGVGQYDYQAATWLDRFAPRPKQRDSPNSSSNL